MKNIVLLLSCMAILISLAHASSQPNVVIIVSDDMGWNDVGYHGSKIQTPNIDRLAKEGMQLERFYVHPVCSPTRTAMMTGRSPARFGITNPLGGDRGVPLDEHFMSSAFQAAGYQTFAIGKWHLGAVGEEYSPLRRGFDHFYGFRNGFIDYYAHTFEGELDWQRDGVPIKEEGYSTDLLAAEAVREIEKRDRVKPMFLYLPFNAPHDPVQAPEALIEKYRKLGGRDRSNIYAAAIDAMDQGIGRVLAALEKEGMTKNTLVLFFCDNGSKSVSAVQGEGGLALRGGKGSLLEGGVRVPAVLRWSDVIPPGSRCEQMISALDLLPTLTAAVGIPHGSEKPLDGINVWPAIRANKVMPRNPLIIAGSRGQFAVLDDPLKLIIAAEGAELYHVRNDPTESRNLAETQAADVARLRTAAEPLMSAAPRGAGKAKAGKGKKKSN